MQSRHPAVGSVGAQRPAATSPRPQSHPRVAAAELCEPGAFALPDYGCFLFLLPCWGHSSRAGEVCGKGAGEKVLPPRCTSLATALPPTCQPGGSVLGELVEGEGREEERGEFWP